MGYWKLKSVRVFLSKLILAIAVYAILNSSVIRLRENSKIHIELRYNPLLALFVNWQKDRELEVHQYSQEEKLSLRKFFSPHRSFNDEKYPLFQSKVFVDDALKNDSTALRDRLQNFIKASQKEKGPFNVILILSESLRAHELKVFNPKFEKEISPSLSKIVKKHSVYFTEALSSGIATHFGQSSAFCSMVSADDFSLVLRAPMNNAVCLSDVFATKNYENYFFYGSTNTFDNQFIFYKKHKMTHVFDEVDMTDAKVKGGWGFSDHELFKFAQAKLSTATQPYFANILTITNHKPFVLPPDAPEDLKAMGEENLEHALIAYSDWSFGEFWKWLKEHQPHTLVIFTADHGHFNDMQAEIDPTFADLRKIARVPLFFASPEMPEDLVGKSVKTLASHADIPPTLLNLMGWENTPNSFLGMDAFSRREPVYIKWVYNFKSVGPGEKLQTIPVEKTQIFRNIMQNNELSPE